MYFRIDDKKLLEKYKTILNKIKDLKNYLVKCLTILWWKIKTKIKIYGTKVYTNFCRLNVPENDTECESFTGIPIDFLLASEIEYYLQVYLDKCAYKVANK